MFFTYLKKQIQNNPERIAVRDSKRELTYRELWDEVLAKRRIALLRGVDRDTKVLLMMNNSCDWVTNVLAFMAIGAKTVMISPDSTEEQVQYLRSELGIYETITKESSTHFFYRDGVVKPKQEFALPDGQNESIYHVTSGSTGEVKICIRTIGQLQAEGEMYQERLEMAEGDVIVCPLPLYHSYAFGAVFIGGLMTGATLVLMERFTPRGYIQKLVQERATLSFIVPIMAAMLVKSKLNQQIDLSGLRYLVVGAGGITREVFEAFQMRFGIALSSNYGSSETGGIITRIDGAGFPSIGRPMKGVSLQIRGEDDEIVETGGEGRIWIKAQSVMNRYFNRADILDENGYFFTGDLGKVDDEGNVYLTGRVKNIVIIGGKKVNPVYVENVFKTHPAIQDAVVVGKKRSNGEECLASVIVLRHEIEKKDVNQFLQSKLEKFMVPTMIEIVDKIPRNSMGKVNHEAVMLLLDR